MTERHMESHLRELKKQLLTMGGHVESAIECATQALTEKTTAKLAHVYEYEKQINRFHIEVDEKCVQLMALQQPLAVDLRLIVAILKINTDLERMGDQAVNIAQNTDRYLQHSEIKPFTDLPQMSKEVRALVREALDSFVKGSEALARDVLSKDDSVDAFKQKIFRDVLEHLKNNPADLEQGLNLILIARNLEKIGDHASNIAEDIIFAITGEDVRHGLRRETLKESLK
jgi:phosphate transport system protein